MIEELRKFIGMEDEPIVMEVERGAIRRYANTVGDPNPLYQNEEYAKRLGFSSVVAPPGFFGWPVNKGDLRGQLDIRKKVTDFLAENGYSRLIEGELGFEFFLPVCAGDVLIARPKIADIYEREGKQGKMFFIVIEILFTKEGAELVAKMRQTLIVR